MIASAPSRRVVMMELTIPADATGWVTKKKTSNAAPVKMRTFLTSTAIYPAP